MSSSSTPSPFPPGAFLPSGLPHHLDPPISLSHPTTGYKLNHLMLRIRSPTTSLHFYREIMGMRTIFIMNVGPFTIYYLGYPRTDAHRSSPELYGKETVAKLQLTEGLLELYHVHGSEDKEEGWYETGNQPPNLGFGHLGFTVPSVPDALERLKGLGVEVIKGIGPGTAERKDVPLSPWEQEQGVGMGDVHEEYKKVFEQIAFVRDPDGYIVELVPQGMDPNDPGGR